MADQKKFAPPPPLDIDAILAKRRERAKEEDALRATGKVVVALNTGREASAEDLGLQP